jgi:hypothetical protein
VGRAARSAWGSGEATKALLPSVRSIRQLAMAERMSASPGMARATLEAVFRIDVRSILPTISAPTLPLFHQHLAQRGNHRTMNHHCTWLFPGTRAGQHISEQVLMYRLRGLGIDIQAARNAALHDLTKEIDPASLADLLGYSTQVMNIHAARAAVPMATYPALKQPTR